jgi:hypothetical protein
MSLTSTSVERARRPNTARILSTTKVTIAVVSGKRQNNHNIVPAETPNIAIKATMFARAEDFSVMPFPPAQIHLSNFVLKLVYPRCNNSPFGKAPNWIVVKHSYSYQPSILSRRQWRAVAVNNSNATPSEAAADTSTSENKIDSSFSTLVISRCWLSEGMNIRELLVFSE